MTMKIIGFDTTDPQSVKEAQEALANIVLPWERDECYPPNLIRVTGLGVRIATVSAHLGGFGDAHNPEKHGWGYQSWPQINGSGSSISGIHMNRINAQAEVDDFLTQAFPQLRVLERVAAVDGIETRFGRIAEVEAVRLGREEDDNA